MRTITLPAVLLSALLATGCAKDSPTAMSTNEAVLFSTDGSHDSQGPKVEASWYNNQRYLISVPSANSANPNQFQVACFHLGVNLNNQRATGPTGTMYAIFNPVNPADPTACFPHDHVLSAVPGVRGYSPRWKVVLALPGANFDPAILPLTSEAAVLAAVAAGQLTLHSPVAPLGAEGDILLAPVLGKQH